MTVFTPELGERKVDDEAGLETMFEEFDSYFMVNDPGGQALLATGQGFGPYSLSWFPGSRDGSRRQTAEDLSKPQVWAAMLDFWRGGTAWREGHEWSELHVVEPGLLDRALGTCYRWSTPNREGKGKGPIPATNWSSES